MYIVAKYCILMVFLEPTGQPADVPGMMQSVSGLGTVSGIGSNAPPDLGQNTGFGHNPRMGMGQNPSGMGPTPSGMAPGGSMMNVPRPNAGPSHMMPTGGGMVDPNRTGSEFDNMWLDQTT